jgi:hypothetical protein
MKSGSKKIVQPSNLLRYIGDGSAIPNVPARDLSEAEINAVAALWKTESHLAREKLVQLGLYATDADLERIAAAGEAGAAAGEQLKNALLQEDGDGTRTEGTS